MRRQAFRSIAVALMLASVPLALAQEGTKNAERKNDRPLEGLAQIALTTGYKGGIQRALAERLGLNPGPDNLRVTRIILAVEDGKVTAVYDASDFTDARERATALAKHNVTKNLHVRRRNDGRVDIILGANNRKKVESYVFLTSMHGKLEKAVLGRAGSVLEVKDAEKRFEQEKAFWLEWERNKKAKK